MKLTHLKLDPAGPHAGIRFEQLSPQLNLVYGPNDSGKTEAIRLVRWVLFGKMDDHRPFRRTDQDASFGWLTANHCGHEFTIRREDDGTPQGHVSVMKDGSQRVVRDDIPSLLGSLEPSDFDHLCVLNFDGSPDMDGLIRAGLSRGIAFQDGESPARRRQELQSELANFREELERLPVVDSDRHALRDRCRELHKKVQAKLGRRKHRKQMRRSRLEESHELARQIAQIQTEIGELEDELRRTEASRVEAQTRADLPVRRGRSRPPVTVAQARRHLAELDAELVFWRGTRDAVERAAQRRVAKLEVPSAEPAAGGAAPCDQAIRCELDYLLICQQVVGRLVESVQRRHDRVAHDLPVASREDATAELTDLQRQRTALEHRIKQRREKGRLLQGRLQHIEARCHVADNNTEVQRLQQQLQEAESQIKVASDRERLRRAITSAESELERLTENAASCAVLHRASEMLKRLTGGKYVRIRISPQREVSVDRASARPIVYDQLSRGARDQVYLCLAMAIRTAADRHGLDMPLILNDAFVHVDSERDAAMAQLICEFARQGHQVLLFTRHRHVVALFRDGSPRLFELPTGDGVAGPTRVSAEGEPQPSPSESTRGAPRVEPEPAQDRPAPEPHPWLIRGRRWAAEEFPGELTDRVRVVRDRQPVVETRTGETRVRLSTGPARSAAADDSTDGRSPSQSAASPSPGRQPRQSASKKRKPGRRPGDADRRERPLRHAARSPEGRKGQQRKGRPREHRREPYHMSESDSITKIKSIGTRTANRLQQLGVRTVADLLQMPPRTLAKKLGSRIGEGVVRQWQAQVRLACRVPDLHPRDAHLLAACDVTDPHQLSEMEPETLWQRLSQQFGRGRRRSRGNTKPPELKSVAQWVNAARNARPRRAA